MKKRSCRMIIRFGCTTRNFGRMFTRFRQMIIRRKRRDPFCRDKACHVWTNTSISPAHHAKLCPMLLPRFDFAPHEWPPLALGPREGVSDAVFRVVWDGEEVEVAARWVELSRSVILFFRFSKKAQDTWVLASHQHTPDEFGLPVGSIEESHRSAKAQAHVEDAIKQSFFGRAQNLDISAFGFSGTQWLYLSVDGRSGCWNGGGSSKNPVIFRVSAEASCFEQELANPASDVRFALQWSYLSGDERISKAICFSNGDMYQLERVVRAIGIMEATRANLPKRWEVVFADALHFGMNSLTLFHPTSENARLRRWSHHLNRYFNPHKDEELAASYLCVRHFAIAHYASFVEGPPSQHERLEAALFLREWATGKIAPDELALLLPKL